MNVVIAVTEFGCLMGAAFAQAAYEALAGIDDIDDLAVELDDKFDWKTEDMSSDYRARLAEHRQVHAQRFQGIRVVQARPNCRADPITSIRSVREA